MRKPKNDEEESEIIAIVEGKKVVEELRDMQPHILVAFNQLSDGRITLKKFLKSEEWSRYVELADNVAILNEMLQDMFSSSTEEEDND